MTQQSELKRSKPAILALGAVSRGFVALSCLGILAASTVSARADVTVQVGPRKVRKAVPPAAVDPQTIVLAGEPVPELPPAAPLTPGQMAPNPPGVSFDNGQLTILAENSTMADILSAVSTVIGAKIDVPAGAGGERVWIQIGPGPTRSVLAQLLSGTDLDFVIQSADADPTQVQSVLLTPRMKGSAPSGSNDETMASRINRFRNHQAGMDSGEADSTPATPIADTQPTTPVAETQPATPEAGRAAAPPLSASGVIPDIPAGSPGAQLPPTISESQAHPAPTGDTQQGVPQLLSLFELRRQLQEQANAQLKAGTH